MEPSLALLRIYTDENARKGDHLVYVAILERARAQSLAGATVLRGLMGLGGTAQVHRSQPLTLDRNLPVVVEIVDEADRLRAFASSLDDLSDIGLITIERVDVLRQHSRGPAV